MQPAKKKKEFMRPFAQALMFQVLAGLKKMNTKKPGRKSARRRSGI